MRIVEVLVLGVLYTGTVFMTTYPGRSQDVSSYLLTANLHIIYKFVGFSFVFGQESDYVLNSKICLLFLDCWDLRCVLSYLASL